MQGSTKSGAVVPLKIRKIGLLTSTTVAGMAMLVGAANAQTAAANQAPPAASGAVVGGQGTSQDAVAEVVVHGIRRGELVLPTMVNSSSSYGLPLSVMDTPRNNTLLSKAQLDALNIQNPAGFSYLTSSSYTDASFGVPNVPRIRGQYADMYFNGMRDSFTANGYGAPASFNSVDSINITKGPASVQAGPGAGVGGSIDVTTKVPSTRAVTGAYDLELDTQGKRRGTLDIGGPLTSTISGRLSVTSDDSRSYYNGMYFNQQSVYGVVLAQPSPAYDVQVSGEFVESRYRENDGVNRVNQGLIDKGLYLTGGPTDTISNFLTPVYLGGSAQLDPRVNIDEADGTHADSVKANVQIIKNYHVSDGLTITNNTFFDYLNRSNVIEYYFADSSKGSFTIENKTDVKTSFSLGSVKNDLDFGVTYRYAHVEEYQDYGNDPVSVYDLTGAPNSWVFPSSLQSEGGAVPFTAAFGRTLYAAPARTPGFLNGSIISNLQDAAIFLEHRAQLSPQVSLLYGVRGDVVQLSEADPLGGPDMLNGFPQSQKTGWYGLYNANVSLVYSPTSHVSAYLTYNNAQYVDPNSNDGAIGTYGIDPALQLRQNTLLDEAGLKFDLLNKELFVSTAIFNQERSVPVGAGNSGRSLAHIKGAEIELNYQPNRWFFMTASYSYLNTTLDTPAPFYNYPAQPGLNYDGAGLLAVFAPNQKFQDPGLPAHLFNFLANYQLPSGIGFQANLQVTGPIAVSQSGQLDLSQSSFVPDSIVANGGYFQSPTIPWQYTLNAAVSYKISKEYLVKLRFIISPIGTISLTTCPSMETT